MRRNTFKSFALVAAISTPLFSTDALAQRFSVEVTNLTGGVYFTPFLIAAHNHHADLFTAGEAASSSLQAMAEGGDISALASDIGDHGVMVANPAGGLLLPGVSAQADFTAHAGDSPDGMTMTYSTDGTDFEYLSMVAMILPTNDGFVGLDSWKIPEEPGSYMITLNAYDAGTEANDEMRGSGVPGEAGFPVPPGSPVDMTTGENGAGVSASAEGAVLIHRGVIGDTNNAGGASDIDSTQHRWLNPVARVVVTVME